MQYYFDFTIFFKFSTGNLNERYDTMAQDKSALERGKDRLQVNKYYFPKFFFTKFFLKSLFIGGNKCFDERKRHH